jgi:hypothetical protein
VWLRTKHSGPFASGRAKAEGYLLPLYKLA